MLRPSAFCDFDSRPRRRSSLPSAGAIDSISAAEGTGGGGLTFDFARDEVRIDNVRTSLNPTEVAAWVDRDLLKNIAPYRFGKTPPNLTIDGVVHTKGGPTTKFTCAKPFMPSTRNCFIAW